MKRFLSLTLLLCSFFVCDSVFCMKRKNPFGQGQEDHPPRKRQKTIVISDSESSSEDEGASVFEDDSGDPDYVFPLKIIANPSKKRSKRVRDMKKYGMHKRNDGLFYCPDCSFSTQAYSYFKNHLIREEHGGAKAGGEQYDTYKKDDGKYYCSTCNKTFSSAYKLREHFKKCGSSVKKLKKKRKPKKTDILNLLWPRDAAVLPAPILFSHSRKNYSHGTKTVDCPTFANVSMKDPKTSKVVDRFEVAISNSKTPTRFVDHHFFDFYSYPLSKDSRDSGFNALVYAVCLVRKMQDKKSFCSISKQREQFRVAKEKYEKNYTSNPGSSAEQLVSIIEQSNFFLPLQGIIVGLDENVSVIDRLNQVEEALKWEGCKEYEASSECSMDNFLSDIEGLKKNQKPKVLRLVEAPKHLQSDWHLLQNIRRFRKNNEDQVIILRLENGNWIVIYLYHRDGIDYACVVVPVKPATEKHRKKLEDIVLRIYRIFTKVPLPAGTGS